MFRVPVAVLNKVWYTKNVMLFFLLSDSEIVWRFGSAERETQLTIG